MAADRKPFAEKLRFLNRDALKYLALFLMTLGHWEFHIYHITNNKPLLLFSIAAQFFAPPVFFFFIAEGYHYTKSKKQYALRLGLCTLITQIPHTLSWPDYTWKTLFLQWSVLLTLFLGLLSLIVIHSTWKLPLRLLCIAGMAALSRIVRAEWAVGGIVLILCFDLLREKKPLLRFAAFTAVTFAVVCVQVQGLPSPKQYLRLFLPVMLGGLTAVFCYNGKKGHFPTVSKYVFYIWYPLHLLLSWVFGLLGL